MAEVVQHSTQYLTDDDLAAIAHYLKSLPANGDEPNVSASAPSRASSANESSSNGGAWYEEYCVTCHRADGAGVTGAYSRPWPAMTPYNRERYMVN